MKKLIFICFIVSLHLSCKTDKCRCELSSKELELINSQMSEIKRAVGFHHAEQIKYKDPKIDITYKLQVENLLLNYLKTYKLVKSIDTPYLETILAEKYIEDKYTKHKILKKQRFNLSSEQWNEIENTIESKCFWTSEIYPQENNDEDVFSYTLEGINLNSNVCTRNYFHRIIRNSRTQEDIAGLLKSLMTIEPLTDLDSLVSKGINK